MRSFFTWIMHMGKRLGLSKVDFVRNTFDRIIRLPIPLSVTVQNVKMPHVILRMYLRGVHEPETTALVRRMLREGDTFVDLGADFGYYTLLCASLVGLSGTVITFEPYATSGKKILSGIKANRFKNISLQELAVGDRIGEADLYISKRSVGRSSIFAEKEKSSRSVPVSVTTLDAFFDGTEGPICLIKIDIEGAELAAVRGGRQFFKRHSETGLVIEIAPKTLLSCGTSSEELLTEIRNMGFSVFRILLDGAIVLATDTEIIKEATERSHCNIYCKQESKE